MRQLTAAQTFVLGLTEYQPCIRVLVDRGDGTMVDLTTLQGRNWVKTAQWIESMTQNTATFTITLIREFFFFSIAPLVTSSLLNQLTGSELPLLAPGRKIEIDTAVIPIGAEPQSSDWIVSLQGRIDVVDPGTTDFEVQLTGRDLGGEMADRVAEQGLGSPEAALGCLLETSMQSDVIDQIYTPVSGTGDQGAYAPVLYVPNSPGWVLSTPFAMQPGQGCLDQLQQMAQQIGWDVRYLWVSSGPNTGSFSPVLWQPQRAPFAPSVNEIFEPFQMTDCSMMPADISWCRNVVEVNYGQTAPPAGTVQGGSYLNPFNPIFAFDNTSIDAYSRRFCAVGLAATSNILDSTHATDLANAVLDDLETPIFNGTEIDLMFRPEVQLGDYDTFKAATVPGGVPWWDTDQTMGVIGVQHEFDLPGDSGDQARAYTTLTLWAYPATSAYDWMQALSLAGASPAVKNGPPPPPSILGTQGDIRGISIYFDRPDPNLLDWYETQGHISTTSGFTPSSTTLIGRAKNGLLKVS